MKKRLLIVAAILAASFAAEAQQSMPHGRWWRRPAMASKLELTREQQRQLDTVFQTASAELIDNRAEVKKLEISLRSELDRPELRRAEVQRIASQLSAARARLFERELMMLVEIRLVLNTAQWERLQDEQRPRFRPGRLPGAP